MARPKAHLDARTRRLIAAVAKAANKLGIRWMVTGAAGRVLLLETVYRLPPGRATQDVDLGVMVADWSRYQKLIERICEDGEFQPDPKQRQRLRFRNDGLLDLVPFGGIESGARTIQWPPEEDFSMTVMGFREAYADAVEVDADGIIVRVVSPVGLMLLKLVAWKQRHYTEPKKDAADMAYLLRHFAEILTAEALFEHYKAELEAADFDQDLAGCRVLGEKMATIAEEDSRASVLEIVSSELKDGIDSALVREIAELLPMADEERVFDLLKALTSGFLAQAEN